MDILVFVKQVPDDSVEIHLDGAGVPAVKDVEKVTNAFDTYALELATRYTEANGGEVTVAAIGTEDCTSMMKNLLQFYYYTHYTSSTYRMEEIILCAEFLFKPCNAHFCKIHSPRYFPHRQ